LPNGERKKKRVKEEKRGRRQNPQGNAFTGKQSLRELVNISCKRRRTGKKINWKGKGRTSKKAAEGKAHSDPQERRGQKSPRGSKESNARK